MGAPERNPRLHHQWLGLHTAPTSGKKFENPQTASKHQEVHDKNTRESRGETCMQYLGRIVWHPRGGRAIFTYTGLAEVHKPMVACHIRPNKMSPRLRGDYKTYKKTHHSGMPDGKQLTTLHQVLR